MSIGFKEVITMLRSINEVYGYTLDANDGHIGRCKDFLFDDQFWTIRYMVADTGKWLPGRQVLISPISLGEPSWAEKAFPVNLTQGQIMASPGIDYDAPVTRQYEKQLSKFYGYPPYWIGPQTWGAIGSPWLPVTRASIDDEELKIKAEDADIHLRSSKEVKGYHIHAADGQVGHVEDFIMDDENWTLRYLIVNTRNWLPGERVLITPFWVELVEWSNRKVQVNMTVEEIKGSPAFAPNEPVNREYEERLYDYYGRPRYWVQK